MSAGGEYELVPPSIRVTLRNIGDQVSVVTSAQLEILDYAYLPQCQPGAGPIAVSQSYDAVLPVNPRPNEKIEVNVAQQTLPNETDQFAFALQLSNPDAPHGQHMYQLKVALIRDGAEKMDAGVAVVGAPVIYDADPSPENLAASGETGACYRQLAVDYQRVQAWRGERASGNSQ